MAEPTTKPYTVLRAICVAGERVEIGDTVELTIVQYTELAHAGKVGPLAEKKAKGKGKHADKPAETPADAPAPSGDSHTDQGGEGQANEGAAA